MLALLHIATLLKLWTLLQYEFSIMAKTFQQIVGKKQVCPYCLCDTLKSQNHGGYV